MRRGGNRCRIYNTRVAALPLAAPILSCFDLYVVILDEYNELADYNVSKHILDVHRCEEAGFDVLFRYSRRIFIQHNHGNFSRSMNKNFILIIGKRNLIPAMNIYNTF